MGEVEGEEEREMRTERLQRISETSELFPKTWEIF